VVCPRACGDQDTWHGVDGQGARYHRLDGLGQDVGPDLVTIRNRPAQSILSDIIRPSASIAQNYESYVVDTRSGGMIEGIMSAQTPTTITIRHEAGREDVIRRAGHHKHARHQSVGDAFEQVSYEIEASRLKPGCAENAIVNGFLRLIERLP
jgi:putative heme-binding domain-containing protein